DTAACCDEVDLAERRAPVAGDHDVAVGDVPRRDEILPGAAECDVGSAHPGLRSDGAADGARGAPEKEGAAARRCASRGPWRPCRPGHASSTASPGARR